MNYLGHIFLSGENEHLMVGNFIADYVKGKKYLEYPTEIQKGILLHRSIDHFTDNNIHWQSIREMIRPVYNRYAGVATDLFIDHFLALHWNQYSAYPLSVYAKWTHAIFLRNYSILPERVKGFIAYLIQHKRLLSYSEINGIEESLYIMSLRTSLPDKTGQAINLLIKNYHEFEQLSSMFLTDIIDFTAKQLLMKLLEPAGIEPQKDK
jgi:acyl carrier protein phosphodiesterase